MHAIATSIRVDCKAHDIESFRGSSRSDISACSPITTASDPTRPSGHLLVITILDCLLSRMIRDKSYLKFMRSSKLLHSRTCSVQAAVQ
jgi:hypothetical protein